MRAGIYTRAKVLQYFTIILWALNGVTVLNEKFNDQQDIFFLFSKFLFIILNITITYVTKRVSMIGRRLIDRRSLSVFKRYIWYIIVSSLTRMSHIIYIYLSVHLHKRVTCYGNLSIIRGIDRTHHSLFLTYMTSYHKVTLNYFILYLFY